MMQLRQNETMDQGEKGLHRTMQLYLQALTHSAEVYTLIETRDFLQEKASPNFNTCSHFRRGHDDSQILGMQRAHALQSTSGCGEVMNTLNNTT